MQSNQAIRVPTGRLVGGILLALVLGALLPLIAVLQIALLMPVLMLGGIFAVYLKGRAGWIPAGVLIAAELAVTAWFMGAQMMFMLLAAAVLPALFVMRGVALKKPFFEQLGGGVAAYIAGLLVAMLLAYASFGSGMVARFADVLRAEFGRMPDAALQPFADAVNSAMTLGGMQGTELFTVDMYRAQLTGILDLMQQTYAQSLPGTLLGGALLSGVLSVLWGNWTMARQGMATNESFIGLSGWFLPAQITIGALALWAAGYILASSGYAGGVTVYATVGQLTGAVFMIQAMSAVNRRMLRAGSPLSRRRVMIALLSVGALLFGGIATVLVLVGAASALFGSRGAVKLWLQKRQNDHSDRNDPDQ